MKIKLLLASLLLIPTLAQADFVADCKAAYVQGDLGVRINQYLGASINREAAEKPFTSRCECIAQTVYDDKMYEVDLLYLEHNGLLDDRRIARNLIAKARLTIETCEAKITKERTATYAKEFQSRFEQCIKHEQDVFGNYYSYEAKKKSWEEIQYSRSHNGNFLGAEQDELSQEARDLTIKSMSRCS